MSTTMDHTSAVDLAHTALARFGLPPDTRIEFVKYRENWVYRLRCGDGRSFAMRIHRPGYRSDDAIRAELNHLAALHESGLLVPQVLPALDGDTMCALVDEDGQRHQIDVQRWFEGSEPLGAISEAFDGSSDLEPDTFRRLGELAATMHTCTQNIGVPTGLDRGAWISTDSSGRHRCGAIRVRSRNSRPRTPTFSRGASPPFGPISAGTASTPATSVSSTPTSLRKTS
ncbi:phosphotransferase [Rhodococcus opacus]|nr:phosphotransferase [Rhodococcus opacus]